MKEINWLSYWKKNLSDSLNSDIDVLKFEHFIVQKFDINSTSITNFIEVNRLIDIEEKRINNAKGVTLVTNENWQKIQDIQILISPFSLLPIPEHKVHTGDFSIKRPFWFYAKIDRTGNLSIPEELFPVIQRRYLEPVADERTAYVFSSMEQVDNATSVSFPNTTVYLEYLESVNKVFEFIAEKSLINYKTDSHNTVYDAIILLPNEEIGAAKSIVELYHRILEQKKVNPKFQFPLLSKFIGLEHPKPKSPVEVSNFMIYNALHLGQMGFDFPISISQRKALYSFNEKEQSVFAVNGPPGTGKTTLLQCIVANEMVKSAIIGNQPTLILACSNNNQAVTNIIDSFSKSNTKEGYLQGRWLPNMEGYATYLPALGKTEAELAGINFKKLNGDGLFARVESSDYLNNAKQNYLKKASEYLNMQIEHLTVNRCIERLRDELISIKQNLESIPQKWQQYINAEQQFSSTYLNDKMDKNDYYQNEILTVAKFETDIKELTEAELKTNQYFDKEPIFRKILCFLGFKSAYQSRASQINILLRDTIIKTPASIAKFNRVNTLDLIDKKINTGKAIIKGISVWYKWKKENNIVGNPPQTEEEYWKFEYRKIDYKEKPNCFYDELDVTIRHKAFQLALHYWEGRWIIENENKGLENKGEKDTKKRWLRHAMLTPCFVSTFYMTPKFFAHSKHLGHNDIGGNIWGDGSMFNFVDILIVDEAGQVAPEVGIATFSLAKKAIIVGDILQIEPIWNTTKPVDLGNLKKCELITSYDDKSYDKIYDGKGFLSSSGSIVKMAQNSCDYKEKQLSEKGVLLREHRRCYNEIINYCNRLAYNGLLIPLKGNSPQNSLFKPMILIDINGESMKINNSRFNEIEATSIVKWLVDNKTKIENKYGSIEENVGIITPFVSQKLLLKRKLEQAGFNTNKIKLGTVHALQGAERPIVLFSMVYGVGEVATMFFDRSPNMLNVAVSRAKDSFIVFANKKILSSNSKSPSGLLTSFLNETLA